MIWYALSDLPPYFYSTEILGNSNFFVCNSSPSVSALHHATLSELHSLFGVMETHSCKLLRGQS